MSKPMNLVIKNCIDNFNDKHVLEDINDWQGNETTNENRIMMVQRNVRLKMVVPDSVDILVDLCQPDLPWAEDHFQERLEGPSNPGKTYKWWPYHQTLDSDKKYLDEVFSHTYQERFWPKKAGEYYKDYAKDPFPRMGIRFDYGDLNDIINLLKNNPTTRQAYLPIWFPEDTWAANNQERVPCTLGYYFYYEYGLLHCNYIIRSCDLFRHFRNDIYLTSRLLQHVAEQVGDNPGNLLMDIYNLHLFRNDTYPFNIKEKRLQNGKNNT